MDFVRKVNYKYKKKIICFAVFFLLYFQLNSRHYKCKSILCVYVTTENGSLFRFAFHELVRWNKNVFRHEPYILFALHTGINCVNFVMFILKRMWDSLSDSLALFSTTINARKFSNQLLRDCHMMWVIVKASDRDELW